MYRGTRYKDTGVKLDTYYPCQGTGGTHPPTHPVPPTPLHHVMLDNSHTGHVCVHR